MKDIFYLIRREYCPIVCHDILTGFQNAFGKEPEFLHIRIPDKSSSGHLGKWQFLIIHLELDIDVSLRERCLVLKGIPGKLVGIEVGLSFRFLDLFISFYDLSYLFIILRIPFPGRIRVRMVHNEKLFVFCFYLPIVILLGCAKCLVCFLKCHELNPLILLLTSSSAVFI